MNVHSNMNHNSQKVRITQMSTNSIIYKQNTLYSYNGLYSNENKLTEIHATLILEITLYSVRLWNMLILWVYSKTLLLRQTNRQVRIMKSYSHIRLSTFAVTHRHVTQLDVEYPSTPSTSPIFHQILILIKNELFYSTYLTHIRF